MHPKYFVDHRDNLLVSLLKGLTGRNFEDMDCINQYHTSIVIEGIYSLLNFKWVFLYSFVSNLIQSFISGSKTVSVLNGKLSSGGSYYTYNCWMKEIGSKPLKCPNGDLDTYIDNIGKYLVKTYQVMKYNSLAADIITTTLHIPLQGASIQSNQSLKPINWSTNVTEDLQKT